MNKFQFVFPIATALGIAFLLSCSNVDLLPPPPDDPSSSSVVPPPPDDPSSSSSAVVQAQCTSNQGEWDANAKKCVKCPDGTSMNAAGQCETGPIEYESGTIVCPAKTKLDESGTKCVADIIAVDPNAPTGKYYCDYGEPDPLAETTGDGCFEIEYQSQCDTTWGKLVASCQTKDRRTDIKYCDFGPVNEYGGGCYLMSSADDCDKDWGIVASKCGTQIQWPDGTVCPISLSDECRVPFDPSSRYCDYGRPYIEDGEVLGDCWPIATQIDRDNCQQWGTGVNACPAYTCPAGTARPTPGAACAITSTNPTPTSFYCDYGYIHSTDLLVDEGGGCFEIQSTSNCDSYGRLVNSCNASDRRTDLNFCDYGEWTTYKDESGKTQIGGGCWAIRTTEDLNSCDTQWASIVKKCPWLN